MSLHTVKQDVCFVLQISLVGVLASFFLFLPFHSVGTIPNMFNFNYTILSHEVDCTRWGIDSMVLAMVQGMCREGEMHLFGR